MSDTSTSTAGKVDPDPAKHVNYVHGMVLGVDDFDQEFAYLDARDRLLARDLGGSGVLRGLRVSAPAGAPEILVSAGLALTPDGHLVRVPTTQRALLVEWLVHHRQAILDRAAGPTAATPIVTIPAYVVLAYARQEVDLVPIPGEPCRTDDEAMQPSRVADDYVLELRLDPPEQREREAIDQYTAWLLEGIALVDTPAPAIPEFLAAIAQAAAAAPKDTPAPSGDPAGTPPKPLPPNAPIFAPAAFSAQVPRARAAEYLAAAVRYFSTLRAEWQGFGATPDGTPPDDDALLLAQVDLQVKLASLVTGSWEPGPALVHEEVGARLVPLAFLQQLVLATAQRAWQAVAHMAPDSRYLVVAAGTVTVKDAVPPAGAAARLVAWASADGVVSVEVRGAVPPGLHDFVVKALPLAKLPAPDLAVSFLALGAITDTVAFTLRVTSGGAATTVANLKDRQIMIEVGAYGA